GVAPDLEEHPDDADAHLVRGTGDRLGEEYRRIGRCTDHREEEFLFGGEVVIDQRRIDSGAGGYPADRGTVETALGEGVPGRVDDRVLGVRAALAPAGACHAAPVSRTAESRS